MKMIDLNIKSKCLKYLGKIEEIFRDFQVGIDLFSRIEKKYKL